MLVTRYFELNPFFKRNLRRRVEKFGFGLLGKSTYERTYSRLLPNGKQERWADTVIRCIEGVFSIRKSHFILRGLPWDDSDWQSDAMKMAEYMFEFKMLPPGRGLWAQGTPLIYERGSMALNNCAYTDVKQLSNDAAWIMDALMLGVGVGFGTHTLSTSLQRPRDETYTYVIPDSREGWVEATKLLITSYEIGGPTVEFDYSLVRPAGERIRGFGGIASGPEPLRQMHVDVRRFLEQRARGEISDVRLAADVVNRIATCVVAGNVRRSALIALGNPDDQEFLDLKDWEKNPERNDANTGWGHTSNNSVILREPDDFDLLTEVADRIGPLETDDDGNFTRFASGEPGIFNLMNVQKYARIGEKRPDRAVGINPCGEIPLESKELCNLVEVFPTRCKTEREFFEAIRLSTLYASSVALLPTHSDETNAIIERNRRIGVSLSGLADWFEKVERKSDIVRLLNKGYDLVQEWNVDYANQAHVPPSVRTTTVKPSGTISLLAGVSPGMHHPIFTTYKRRISYSESHPLVPLLMEAGLEWEVHNKDPKTLLFSFPIHQEGVRSQDKVSLFEHGMRLVLLSRFWANNAVSNTTTFHPTKERRDLRPFLTYTAPHVKSIALLALSEDENVYPQSPYEAITVNEFQRMTDNVREVDWTRFYGSDGMDEKFCANDICTV